MNRPNVLCLAIDGLRPDFLGVYGNSICATPAFDALATESAVFDFAYCQSPELNGFYNEAWSGERSLVRAAGVSGYRSMLLTDDRQLGDRADTGHFSEVIVLPDHNPSEPAVESYGGRAVRLLVRGADWIGQVDSADSNQDPTQPWLAWIHCGALAQIWDAPLGPFFDGSDLDPQRLAALIQIPDGANRHVETDDVEIFRERYADQVEALDCGLQLLLEALAEREQYQNTLLVLVGLRGFPLGEHGQFGFTAAPLFEELIHVPLLIHTPDGIGRLTRSSHLATTADVAPTIYDACHFGGPIEPPNAGMSLLPLLDGDPPTWRDAILFQPGCGERAIRTHDWFLRMPGAEAAGRIRHEGRPLDAELYSKPDDRWDVNEIGNRCEEVVAELVTWLGQHLPSEE